MYNIINWAKCKIAPSVVFKNFIEIRENTVIGKNCFIDSRVNISGNVTIGEGVTLRYGVILAKGCTVGDNTYIAPRVMTNNLDKDKNSIGGAKIGANCFIGTHSVLAYGITICDNVTIGANTTVLKSITSPGTYINSWVDGKLKLKKI